jgi:hypothetical protein
MQPYFLPYIGYFQLIEYCDAFVIYDNIQYTKRGWINRNRILFGDSARTITIPLRGASDYLDIRDREIAPEFDRDKLLALLRQSYGHAPFWDEHEPLLATIVNYPVDNLFDFVAHSITRLAETLAISTKIIVSSSLVVDASLRGEQRVVATCSALGASEYVNPIGGLNLYSEAAFGDRGIRLSFLRSRLTPYPQFSVPHVEALSVIDAMMFVEPQDLRARISSDYDIIER